MGWFKKKIIRASGERESKGDRLTESQRLLMKRMFEKFGGCSVSIVEGHMHTKKGKE